MKQNEYLLFLRSFFHSPKRVGSVIPSSQFLAKKMVEQVQWDGVKAVAELGSGTGPITRYINHEVSPSATVLLYEMDDTMRNNLQVNYPNFSTHSNALQLVETMRQKGIEQLDCIFSGLPFFNFEPELREGLVDQIYKALKPGGLFIAFQYSLQMKRQLSENFVIEKIDFVPMNIPPAFVYVCRKREL